MIFENNLLTRIFVRKTEEVTERRRKPHSEGIGNLYSSSNIIRIIESKLMRWRERVASMGEMKNAYNKNLVKT
jgi:hypothetical protein